MGTGTLLDRAATGTLLDCAVPDTVGAYWRMNNN